MSRIALVLVALVFVGQPMLAVAKSPERLALLIGNQKYAETVGPLANPHNDVNLIAAALKQIGFQVTVLKDASYRKMDIAIRQHVDRVRTAGDGTISFFYYWGHGVANPDTKQNYLVPVDVTNADDANIWFESFQQNEIINRLVNSTGDAVHYVVFDACRNELKLTGPSAKSLGRQKGFVAVAEKAGILIAYATAPGETASDAGKGSGPYAQALADEITKPGVEAVTMFRNVQLKVKQAIGQDPWLSFPALPAVYLAGKEKQRPKPAVAEITSPTFAQQAELAFWNSVKDSKDPVVLWAYVQQFPKGTFTPLARILINKLQKSTEKQTLALIKQEELRAAREKEKLAQAARDLADRKAAQAQQTEELGKARAEAKKAREALRLAEEQRAAAVKAAEEARLQKERAEREAELAANMKVAALTSLDETEKKTVPPSSAKPGQQGYEGINAIDLAKRVQAELKRVGCLTGSVDGIWGNGSRRSMSSFNKYAKLKISSAAPTTDALAALSRQKTRVCPSQTAKTNESVLRLPSGSYTVDDGRKVQFKCKKTGSCTANIGAGGLIGPARLIGKINASGVFDGFWVIALSLQKCSKRRYSSFYWGRARLKFNAGRTAWKGHTGYCNGPLSDKSNASR